MATTDRKPVLYWVTLTIMFAAFCGVASTAKAEETRNRQIDCWKFLDLDERIIMTLPIPNKLVVPLVTMTLNGMEYPALYLSDGLQHRWVINPADGGEELNLNYQVVVRADLTAGYYDFSNVPDGEETGAETSFSCRMTSKRGKS